MGRATSIQWSGAGASHDDQEGAALDRFLASMVSARAIIASASGRSSRAPDNAGGSVVGQKVGVRFVCGSIGLADFAYEWAAVDSK